RGARPRQGGRVLTAEAAEATGHDRDLAVEAEQVIRGGNHASGQAPALSVTGKSHASYPWPGSKRSHGPCAGGGATHMAAASAGPVVHVVNRRRTCARLDRSESERAIVHGEHQRVKAARTGSVPPRPSQRPSRCCAHTAPSSGRRRLSRRTGSAPRDRKAAPFETGRSRR